MWATGLAGEALTERERLMSRWKRWREQPAWTGQVGRKRGPTGADFTYILIRFPPQAD